MTIYIRAIFFLWALCLCLPYRTAAKISPAEGAVLNYRLVGFSFPGDINSSKYRVEIAKGNITDDAQFVTTLSSRISGTVRILTEVPAFDAAYTWRIVYNAGSKNEYRGKLYHFSTGALPRIGNAVTRLRVLTPQTSNLNSYIVLNGSRTLYDMKGNPVWFLPDLEGANSSANDIKFTPQHTVSLLYNGNAYEVNYNGDVLWKTGPAAGTVVSAQDKPTGNLIYHHEFTRLQNGHYMALGSMRGAPAQPVAAPGDDSKKERYRFFPGTLSSIIYEFDETGKVVWTWDTRDYIGQSDIHTYLGENFPGIVIDAHENSVYFDLAFKVVYLSLCSFNRVIAISYPSGKVMNTYGTEYKPGTARHTGIPGLNMACNLKNGLFSGQHSCGKLRNGNIYLYNNNMCDTNASPQVLILQEPGKDGNSLKKLWQFDCPVDDYAGLRQGSGGGSIKEMDNGSLFVMMNSPYSKTFIVSQDKKVQWSAICEVKDESTGGWAIAPSYRASIINQRELEQLIWSHQQDAGN